MKRITVIVGLLGLLVVFIATAASAGSISFYTFNNAFKSVKIYTDGHEYCGKFIRCGYDPQFARLKEQNIKFPHTDGRNATVFIEFRGNDGEKEVDRLAAFKLADYSYQDHPFCLAITDNVIMTSNFGPVEEGLRRISRWEYPEDCLIRNSYLPARIDYNRKRIRVGEWVWINAFPVGDGVYSKLWLDKNGYIFPHRFNGKCGWRERLRLALVVEENPAQKHDGHPSLKIRSYCKDGYSYDLWAYEVIPEQGVALINW